MDTTFREKACSMSGLLSKTLPTDTGFAGLATFCFNVTVFSVNATTS